MRRGLAVLSASCLLAVASALPSTPVNSIEALVNLTDAQLWDLFTEGDASIPAVNTPGRYTTCPGYPLINAFTTQDSAWPLGPLPPGKSSPFNEFFGRLWYGKIFYTDPDTHITSLYNMVWSNSSVEFYAAVRNATHGLSPDGKPSIILDYKAGEAVYLREFTDEVRKIGDQVWLGRTWLVDPVAALGKYKTKANAVYETLDQSLKNATLHYLLNALGIEGEGSSTEYPYHPLNTAPKGAKEIEMGSPFTILYFAFQCGFPTNKLHYTPDSLFFQYTNQIDGWTKPGLVLPPLNTVQEPGAINNVRREAAFQGDHDYPPFKIPAFNPYSLGAIGNGISVPDPKKFNELPSLETLQKEYEQAPEFELPLPMGKPFHQKEGTVAEQIDTATQVLLGLTDQPKWIAPFTFEDGFAWASKLAEFLIDTATHRYPSAFKEGLKPENPLKQEG